LGITFAQGLKTRNTGIHVLNKQVKPKQGGAQMSNIAKSARIFILFLTVTGIFSIAAIDFAQACGWGQGGGEAFVPQRRDQNNGFLAQKQAVTEEQARDIVSNYAKKLNPKLNIGNITDNGDFYEAEIIGEDSQVIQLVGVDKQSGRLVLLN
jgi:hypothetical protein